MKYYYFSFSTIFFNPDASSLGNSFEGGLVKSSANQFPLGALQKHLLNSKKFIRPRILFWEEVNEINFAEMSEARKFEGGESIYFVE